MRNQSYLLTRFFSLIEWLFDLFLIYTSGIFVLKIINNSYDLDISNLPYEYNLTIIIPSLTLAFFRNKKYSYIIYDNIFESIKKISIIWFISLISILIIFYFTKLGVSVSRFWFLLWSFLSLFNLIIFRYIIITILRKFNITVSKKNKLLLVGNGDLVEYVINCLNNSNSRGISIIGIIEPNQVKEYLLANAPNLPDEIWLCIPFGNLEALNKVLTDLKHCLSNIRLIPDWFSLSLINHGFSNIYGINMIDISNTPYAGYMRLVKEIENYTLSILILIIISPFFLCICLIIKISSIGPIFFLQNRHGWNGEIIKIYKFRTMEIKKSNSNTLKQVIRNDKRLTKFGNFLRKTSLDELPQFINVLQGKMSIVGPRPHAVEHNEYYKELIPQYMLRHKVKPGITGWAQIHGYRGETDTIFKMQKRIEYDLYYIENMSILLDLKIIIITIKKIFSDRNAF